MNGFWVEAGDLLRKISRCTEIVRSDEFCIEVLSRVKSPSASNYECLQQNRNTLIRYQKKLARLMRRHDIPGPDPESLNLRPKKCKKVGTRYPGKKRTSETACMHPSTDTT